MAFGNFFSGVGQSFAEDIQRKQEQEDRDTADMKKFALTQLGNLLSDPQRTFDEKRQGIDFYGQGAKLSKDARKQLDVLKLLIPGDRNIPGQSIGGGVAPPAPLGQVGQGPGLPEGAPAGAPIPQRPPELASPGMGGGAEDPAMSGWGMAGGTNLPPPGIGMGPMAGANFSGAPQDLTTSPTVTKASSPTGQPPVGLVGLNPNPYVEKQKQQAAQQQAAYAGQAGGFQDPLLQSVASKLGPLPTMPVRPPMTLRSDQEIADYRANQQAELAAQRQLQKDEQFSQFQHELGPGTDLGTTIVNGRQVHKFWKDGKVTDVDLGPLPNETQIKLQQAEQAAGRTLTEQEKDQIIGLHEDPTTAHIRQEAALRRTASLKPGMPGYDKDTVDAAASQLHDLQVERQGAELSNNAKYAALIKMVRETINDDTDSPKAQKIRQVRELKLKREAPGVAAEAFSPMREGFIRSQTEYYLKQAEELAASEPDPYPGVAATKKDRYPAAFAAARKDADQLQKQLEEIVLNNGMAGTETFTIQQMADKAMELKSKGHDSDSINKFWDGLKQMMADGEVEVYRLGDGGAWLPWRPAEGLPQSSASKTANTSPEASPTPGGGSDISEGVFTPRPSSSKPKPRPTVGGGADIGEGAFRPRPRRP